MLKLSHDGIAEDADLVSVWDRLAEQFQCKALRKMVDDAITLTTSHLMERDARELWGGDDTACGEVVS